MFAKLSMAGFVAGAVLLAIGAGAASAQYPPPTGACELRTSATSALTGDSVAITVTVLDTAGNPVAGQAVALAITDQPGGASLSNSGGTTDAAGHIASQLSLGSEAGTVRLTATADTVACSGAVAAGMGAVAPAIVFPDTGTGAGETGSVFGLAGTLLLELGALVIVGGWAASRLHRR
jgi:hypothetical protein